jgi:hypothetical protein
MQNLHFVLKSKKTGSSQGLLDNCSALWPATVKQSLTVGLPVYRFSQQIAWPEIKYPPGDDRQRFPRNAAMPQV